jgi:hypothetical protein
LFTSAPLHDPPAQLIVVTHHPGSIDYLASYSTWLFQKDKDGLARVKRIEFNRDAGERPTDSLISDLASRALQESAGGFSRKTRDRSDLRSRSPEKGNSTSIIIRYRRTLLRVAEGVLQLGFLRDTPKSRNPRQGSARVSGLRWWS